ncbi:MAG: SIMPL domain-containing protein [Bacteroidales bacterium]|nr:SIMPL domain-containing protein [Bacteroidales bacterium]
MENKGNFFAGLAIMAGLVVMGLCIPAAVREYGSTKRSVSVRGLCEREVPADKVIWPLKYRVTGNDLAGVYSEIESDNAAIISFLKAGGIDDAEISVAAPVINDKFAQEYGSNDRLYRYLAKNTVTVCTGKVDEVLKLIKNQKTLLRKGIVLGDEWDGSPTFSFEALNSIKPEMIEEATRNARESAQKFANDSGSKLGKIREANQGYFTIESRDSNTPEIKKVRVVTNVTYYLRK